MISQLQSVRGQYNGIVSGLHAGRQVIMNPLGNLPHLCATKSGLGSGGITAVLVIAGLASVVFLAPEVRP